MNKSQGASQLSQNVKEETTREGEEGEKGEDKGYSEKVDLNDLDWEDRERVLRLLFSKIN